MRDKRGLAGFLLLIAAAFLIGLSLSQCGRSSKISLQTDPPQTSAPAESTGPEATEAPTGPAESTAPPETASPTDPPEPTGTTDSTEATSPPATTPPQATTAPPETSPPPEPTVPGETVPDPNDSSGHTVGSLEYAILDELNRVRTENSLSPLTLDPRLCAAASLRAYELNQLRDHMRPDGRACESILSDCGYDFRSAADSLFCGTPDATAGDIVSAWLNSPENRARLLEPAYTVYGAAVFESDGIINVAAFFVEAP